ncbi:transglutaminase-like cysteine peptidase [Defluviimonas sp. WL0050]|uniref:Transglutaminase-like cysteine peptidase n=1 Tax=Albidovulum litorale TaxID=2984134 RepID=A0ABT2ZQL3_9RHOB|nr:transglutaminase-like cysteine peptidase [Defluviimonas sp. WL0050]MCV2873284.1 transglutaminase-like cysteine peptidase [Defluviimonas sp. WL0050]
MTHSETDRERRGSAFLTGAKSRIGRMMVVAALAGIVPVSSDATQPRPVNHMVARKAIAAPSGAKALCVQHSWACARGGGAHLSERAAMKLAHKVNVSVNKKVRPISDRAQYGVDERWDLPTRRGGDCEDFALLKKKQLVEAGISPETLLIATVLDRNRGAHAVLVLRTSGGDYVLDNLGNRIKPWRDTGYSFIRMQDPNRPDRWVAVLAGGVFDA